MSTASPCKGKGKELIMTVGPRGKGAPLLLKKKEKGKRLGKHKEKERTRG